MKVLVTGAGGFIGRGLVHHLLGKEYDVVAFVRKSEDITYDHPCLNWRVGDIRDAAAVRQAAHKIDYIAHLAAAKSDERESYAINVGGAKNVILAAHASNVRGIVNVSTISTKLKRHGLYAQTKSEADVLFNKSALPCITLRPSVVYGDSWSGIIGSLIRYTRFSVTPIIGSGRATYRPIRADDVANAIEMIFAEDIKTSATYDIGGPNLISFNALARLVAKEVYGKNIHLMHIPLPLAYVLAKLFKMVLRKPPITLSNVIGSAQNVSVNTRAFNTRYNFHPQALADGLAQVKTELENETTEPYAIMRYALFGTRPSPVHVRLYEQAVRFYNLEQTKISPSILRNPRRIKALDAITRFTNPNGIFRRKLFVAATIAECSPVTANMLLPNKTSIPSLLIQMVGIELRSVSALLYGLCLYFFLYDDVSI